jgi:hypothetical protein
MNQNNLSFKSENLLIDWISFNLEGLMDPKIVAHRLLKYFTPHVLIDDVPSIGFHGLKKKYKVSIRQYTGSKGYWVGTQIIFSGKNAAYFYKLIQTQRFNWDLLKFEEHTLTLGRIDLCFSRPNDANHKSRLFDAFLVDSRRQVQNNTNTKYMKLQDFPDGKMLKINRRNNSRHYRVYQKDETARFKLELKHGQTRLVQDYLFQNQLDIFEHQLAIQYFEYSGQVLRSDYPYTDWILDFQRQYRATITFRPVVSSYLENQIIENQEEEERFFHLLQFLSFVKSLRLNPLKGCKKIKIKKQLYYELTFPLSQFVNFTGMQLSNKFERENLISYFYQLQKLDPVVKVFRTWLFEVMFASRMLIARIFLVNLGLLRC